MFLESVQDEDAASSASSTRLAKYVDSVYDELGIASEIFNPESGSTALTYSIKKDISVLVFDEGLGFGNGLLLPAGPLREPKWAINRADAIIVIKNKRPKKI